jgi:hypothetical protein
MIFHLRFIYCEDKGMPGNGIPFVEMLFFLLHPIYLGNIVATKKKNIMEICGIKVMKKNTDKKIRKCYNEVQ